MLMDNRFGIWSWAQSILGFSFAGIGVVEGDSYAVIIGALVAGVASVAASIKTIAEAYKLYAEAKKMLQDEDRDSK